jgi:hypothetical protein
MNPVEKSPKHNEHIGRKKLPKGLLSEWLVKKINHIKEIIKKLLTQGISPQKISIAMVIGFTAGTFPIMGTHTILAIGLAFIFRLNQLAVYLGSWVSAPFYFLMLLPSLRIGEYLFKAEEMHMETLVENLKLLAKFDSQFFDILLVYGKSMIHLMVGWAPLVLALSIPVYFISFFIFKMILSKKNL